jgi:hypothetical protein
MIKIKSIKIYNLKDAIYGMRLPMESHSKMDTVDDDLIGPNDLTLCKKLIAVGTEHRKFLRQIFVSINFVAPLYFLKDFDTYKVGTTSNSTSQNHKLMTRCLSFDDFSCENISFDDYNELSHFKKTLEILNNLINQYKENKNEEIFRKVVQMLPQSYFYERVFTCSMENLYNMYSQRKNHKLKEFRDLFEEIEKISLFRQLFL